MIKNTTVAQIQAFSVELFAKVIKANKAFTLVQSARHAAEGTAERFELSTPQTDEVCEWLLDDEHSNAHTDLQIANHGITFDVSGGHTWFSAHQFERESERITLWDDTAILHTEAAALDISDNDATVLNTGI